MVPMGLSEHYVMLPSYCVYCNIKFLESIGKCSCIEIESLEEMFLLH